MSRVCVGFDKYQCDECHLYFGTAKDFDAHRTGMLWAKRCQDIDALLTAGWTVTKMGYWKRKQ